MGATEVVHDDVGAPRGKEKGIGLTEATTGACYDDGLVVKAQLRHCVKKWMDEWRERREKRTEGEEERKKNRGREESK